MENKSRAGRPKGPQKVYYRKYVKPEEVIALDACLRRGIEPDEDCFVFKALADAARKELEDFKKLIPSMGKPSAGPVTQPAMVHVGSDEMLSKYKADNRALLEDVGRLTEEVVVLKDKLERCARATDDQKTVYWKRRALKAEGSAARGEFDQTT